MNGWTRLDSDLLTLIILVATIFLVGGLLGFSLSWFFFACH